MDGPGRLHRTAVRGIASFANWCGCAMAGSSPAMTEPEGPTLTELKGPALMELEEPALTGLERDKGCDDLVRSG
jgi:hypothetical protein